jgi:osmotically-inducible protein OsmY
MDDESIRREVLHELHQGKFLDVSQVYVAVDRDQVILDGTVASEDERRLAQDIAERSGATEVHNHLRIHQSEHPATQIEERF